MSRRLDVLNALLELFRGALPDADVDGLGDDEEAPTRVGSNGSVTLHAGDPGDPELDLSPLTYNWTHTIPVEVIMADEAALDVALGQIGAAIEADRQLGGLCDWIDVGAPATEPVWMEGADPMRGAPLIVTAIYATSNPLT